MCYMNIVYINLRFISLSFLHQFFFHRFLPLPFRALTLSKLSGYSCQWERGSGRTRSYIRVLLYRSSTIYSWQWSDDDSTSGCILTWKKKKKKIGQGLQEQEIVVSLFPLSFYFLLLFSLVCTRTYTRTHLYFNQNKNEKIIHFIW